MAKEEEEEKKAEEAPPKKSKKMLFIIIGVVVVLAIGGGVGFFIMKGAKKPVTEELAADAASQEGLKAENADAEEPLEEGEEAIGGIFPLDTFVVNLKGGRYIRLQAQLEFATRDIPKRFYGRTVLIRDAVIGTLTQKSADDVLSEKGQEDIKKSIKDIVNEKLKKEEVKRVYFTQFVVQ